MLDTDDPFNSRKKKPLIPTSPTSLDDLPISGNRAAQRLVQMEDEAEVGKENTREMKEADTEDSAPTPPPRISAAAPIKKAREPRVPLRARLKAGGAATASSPAMSEDDGPPPSTAPSHRNDEGEEDLPPIPRSSAATLAAMLDTDDPFNAKKKPMMSLDDLPIAGNKAAQALSAYPDEDQPIRRSSVRSAAPLPRRRSP